MVSTHPGGAQEIPGLDPGWSTQLLRIAQQLEAILADHGGLSGLSDPDHDHGTSLTATSLLDDDHTQYALLAGRGTGQTLNGGLNAGNNLTLLGTAHATAGSVIIQSSSIFEMDGVTGQLKLPTTGSSAGLLIGGDVQLYRTAANVWSTPDSLRVGGYQRVGSETAPTNVTSGDLTVARLNVGNVAFGTGVEAQIQGDAAISGKLAAGVAIISALYPFSLHVGGSVTADGTTVASAMLFDATINAAANGDLLFGGIIVPSFVSAFTNVILTGLQIDMTIVSGAGSILTSQNLHLKKPTVGTNLYYINFDTATADVNVAIGSNVSIPVIIGGVARKIYAT